jgi:hypothetical protein
MVSLRNDRWTFILNQTSSQLIAKPRVELYDRTKDPRERENVAALHPDVVRALELEVATFVAAHHQGESVEEWLLDDPEILAELRALGYVGLEPKGPDLWRAIESGSLEQVRQSLKAGADANQRDEVFGATPLSMAAMAGDVELATLLLAAGAEVEGRNRDGATPLISAAFLGRADVLALFLDRGADRGARNANGDTALAATRVPWDLTAFLAKLLRIEVDREEVEAGRTECAELLSSVEED